MELSKIHHVAIIVSDYEAAREFYVEKLFFPCCVNGFLSTGTCAEKRMLSTCSFVKLPFHNFPHRIRVDSTEGCG